MKIVAPHLEIYWDWRCFWDGVHSYQTLYWREIQFGPLSFVWRRK